ncbi:hypothetical protein L9F63_022841, partial [Diploptera punctata]
LSKKRQTRKQGDKNDKACLKHKCYRYSGAKNYCYLIVMLFWFFFCFTLYYYQTSTYCNGLPTA